MSASGLNRYHLAVFFIVGLLLVYLAAVIRTVFFVHCSSFYDLGIYSEALSRLRVSDLNPFIPGRNIFIFNDHFDPILIPFAFLTSIMKAPLLGLFIEYSSIILCWLPLRLLVQHKKISMKTAVLGYLFLVLNHAVLDALHTPFHPTTWAMLPLMYVFAFYWLEKWAALLMALVILFCCREEFPLMGLPLGTVLLLDFKNKPKFKVGFAVLGLSLAWCTFVFLVRPKVFQGEISHYGASLLLKFFQHPFEPIKAHFSLPMIKMALVRLAPLFLLLSWSELKKHRKHVFFILLIASPILLIRFISVSWAFHYGTAPMVVILFAVFPALAASVQKDERKPSSSFQFRMATAILFSIIIFGSDLTKKIGQGWVEASPVNAVKDRCPMQSERIAAIDQAQEELLSHINGPASILIENNLTGSQLLKTPKATLYVFGGLQPAIFRYDFVLLEKPPHGDAWPSNYSNLDLWIGIWRKSPDVHVIRDDSFVFLASGKISQTL